MLEVGEGCCVIEACEIFATVVEGWKSLFSLLKVVRGCRRLLRVVGDWWMLVKVIDGCGRFWRLLRLVKVGEGCWRLVEVAEVC